MASDGRPAAAITFIKPQAAGMQVHRLLVAGEQIEEQRTDAGRADHLRHVLVPGTVAAAAAPVSEQHNAHRIRGNCQIAAQRHSRGVGVRMAGRRLDSNAHLAGLIVGILTWLFHAAHTRWN